MIRTLATEFYETLAQLQALREQDDPRRQPPEREQPDNPQRQPPEREGPDDPRQQPPERKPQEDPRHPQNSILKSSFCRARAK